MSQGPRHGRSLPQRFCLGQTTTQPPLPSSGALTGPNSPDSNTKAMLSRQRANGSTCSHVELRQGPREPLEENRGRQPEPKPDMPLFDLSKGIQTSRSFAMKNSTTVHRVSSWAISRMLKESKRPGAPRRLSELLKLLGLSLVFTYCVLCTQAKDEEKWNEQTPDCPLMDPRCLLNFTVEAPDYFYRRRHEAPAFPISLLPQPQQREEQHKLQQQQQSKLRDRQTLEKKASGKMLTQSEVFEFAVRRLQGIGGLFSQRQGATGSSGGSDGGGGRRRQQPQGTLSLEMADPLDSGVSRSPRPLLESNGLICEDDERVEDFGVKCRLIARSLGGRLGCEKRLIDISPDGRLPANIPAFSRVADACPMTCGLCEECAPGCALWFLGNTLCDEVCNNAACQFDGGDCWSADCVVGPWAEWSPCSVTCGGPGTERRRREVKSRAKQGGAPCPKLEVCWQFLVAYVPQQTYCKSSNNSNVSSKKQRP